MILEPFLLGEAALFLLKTMIQIKAVGDFELDVLGVPFGGPDNGKDKDGEYFSPQSKLHLDKFQNIPVVAYHGLDPESRSLADVPEYIGTAGSPTVKKDGVWYRVVLDKSKEISQKMMEWAKEGILRASSGSISHLVRRGMGGFIKEWPVAEMTLMGPSNFWEESNSLAVALPVMKAIYQQAGIDLPDGFESDPEPEASAGSAAASDSKIAKLEQKVKTMDEQEKLALIEQGKREALEEVAAAEKAAAERQAEIDTAVKAALDKQAEENEEEKEELKKEAVKANRLPTEDPPEDVNQNTMGDLAKYDNLDAGDLSVMIGILDNAGRKGLGRKASENAYKSLAVRISEEETPISNGAKTALKAAGLKSFKADEIMYQSLSGFGDEWVGVEYSNRLWQDIRQGTFVLGKLPQIEVPPGHESIVIPLESTDPTFYKVAEANDLRSDSGRPDATVTSSQAATTNKTLSLVKGGARVVWSGEMQEDSLFPFVAELRRQLTLAGQEQIEHAIIDGDTAAGASANINDIAGTPAGTELFLMFDGFRKSPLVTTTANSRDGGALTVEDYKETMRLMGAAGINALDQARLGFITDVNTAWKTLELSEVKTRDVFSQAALENGMLKGIWGYEIFVSAFMHLKDSDRLANTAGKIDVDTVANNTTGSILAVRWDQWLWGWRRRMTMEVDRFAEADANQIVALFRAGLIQRDTEASAITYNLSVA